MPANSEYMKEWRKTEAGLQAIKTQKQRAKARYRAITLLARKYPRDWDEIFNRELKRIQAEERKQ